VSIAQSESPYASIAQGSQTLALTGGAGGSGSVLVDLASKALQSSGGRVPVAGDALFTAVNVDGALATGNSLQITGSNSANRLTGSALADTIAGGGGADTISAGQGDDLVSYQADSEIDGGQGRDTLLVAGSFNVDTFSTASGTGVRGFEIVSAARASSGVELSRPHRHRQLHAGRQCFR